MSQNYQSNVFNKKIGILGGGQLGKMLINAANKWSLKTFVLDPSDDCPSATICTNFVKGNFTNYDDVYNFGKLVDIITIEIENVNIEALKQLQTEGKVILPEPAALELIKDKSLQKETIVKNGLPTSKFIRLKSKAELHDKIEKGEIKFPFVQKLCKEGYDGKGVLVIKNNENLNQAFEAESIVEELIDIEKEISVIVAKNTSGEITCYPATEMTFNKEANLVEFLISPAQISDIIAKQADELAKKTIAAFNLTGILAVEMFLDKNNTLYINEIAPRAHNSGHQTIEGSYTSQYEQLLRAILGLPLGNTKTISPTAMLNLLGEKEYTGKVIYQGLNESMRIPGVNIHLYGKTETKPFRKMGHVTVLDTTIEQALIKAKKVQQTLKIIS